MVNAPPLYIQEKVHPKVLIDDLQQQTRARREGAAGGTVDMFGDFNGIPAGADKTDFYAHDQNWTNRMILGDSLQVMASLAEREGLRGKVQCVYLDPPYGIKFNSNFQWSTTSRDVKDGNRDHISREPEQVKAFRDTWRDGINSYLNYLRDRLTVVRDLLTEVGRCSCRSGMKTCIAFALCYGRGVRRVRTVSRTIAVQKTGGQSAEHLASVADYCLWYAKNLKTLKYRQVYLEKVAGEGHGSGARYVSVHGG